MTPNAWYQMLPQICSITIAFHLSITNHVMFGFVLSSHQQYPGLDWDKKSALAYFGPGGPPPLLSLSVYIYIIYTTSQKILNSKIIFFCYQQFFIFHTQHNIISKIQQNKTTDTYSTSQGPIKREGEREGQQEHKSHSFIQSRMSNKNTAKHQWSKAWPHQLAPLYIHMTLFAGGYGSNMFFYTCVV